MPTFETVHTMTDFYDGPRGGVADYQGSPYVYESTFADIDATGDVVDIFRLSPISRDVFVLALEDWAIWLRWETAFHRGEAPRGTHPALPADRARHDELEQLLEGKLEIMDDVCVRATAEFRVREDPTHSGLGFQPLEVAWSPVASDR